MAGAEEAGVAERAEGDEDALPASPDGGADVLDRAGEVGVLDGAGEVGVLDGAGEVGVLDGAGVVDGAGASCEQAAMITRWPAGSALPPTPLRSTK